MKYEFSDLFSAFCKITKTSDVKLFVSLMTILHAGQSKAAKPSFDLEENYVHAMKVAKKLKESESGLSYLNTIEEFSKNKSYTQKIAESTSFYEKTAEGVKHRDEFGAFYTPVNYAVEALQNSSPIYEGPIYDPFCGCGAWLAAAAKIHSGRKIELLGTDIDETAVLFCRLHVAWSMSRSIDTIKTLQKNIVCLNSLYPSKEERKTISSFSKRASLVATNPPYGFSADTSNNQFLATTIIPDKEVFYYSISRILFEAPNASTLFLIPNTFSLNIGAGKFRNWLAENYLVQTTDHSSENLFFQANIRNVLVEIKKGNGTYTRKSFKDPWIKLTSATNVNRASKRSPTIGDYFEVSQGLIPYDKYRGHTESQIKNRVFHAEKRIDQSFKPEIQGRDVSVCRVDRKTNSWIKYGPWLAAPRDPKFFKKPRVLIREITSSGLGRIYCAYTDREFYNTPSIINVVAKDISTSSEAALKTLSVLLSSDQYSSIHMENNPKARKGLFPKILVRDVRNMPLPENFLDLDLSSIYDKAIRMADQGKEEEDIRTFITSKVAGLISSLEAA